MRRMLISVCSAAAATVLLGGLACAGDFNPTGPNQGKVHECIVDIGPGFPQNTRFWIAKPAWCPISVWGLQRVDYSATGEFPVGSTSRQLQLSYQNRTGHITHSAAFAAWSQGGGWDFVQVDDWYLAASGGFDATNSGEDRAFNEVLVFGFFRLATGHLPYRYGANGVQFEGPVEVMPYEGFTLRAILVDPNFMPPVSWSWKRNGADLGVSQSSIYWPGGEMGQWDEFTATVIDGDGRSHTFSHFVHTKSCDTPGCADQ